MSIDAVSSASITQSSNLKMQDFLKIFLTQLNYQDPMKPVDNQQFMAQMAQFTSLEQTQQLNARIDQLISTQSALQSVGLIGRTVDIHTAGGAFTGTVKALSLNGNAPQLTVLTSSGQTLSGLDLAQMVAVR